MFNKIPVHFFGSFFRFIKNPGSFFQFIENPGSFLQLNSRNAGSFLRFTKIVYDADFFELKILVFMLYIVMLPGTSISIVPGLAKLFAMFANFIPSF
jgi:hypothetical protein